MNAKDLARLTHGNSEGWREKITAVIFAYFDASGTHAGSRIMAFGGLLGTGEMWDQFDIAWTRVRERHNLREFHTVDCVNHAGEFLDRSFAERLSIMGEFIDALTSCRLLHIGWALLMDDWKRLTNAERERLGNDPWALGFTHCLHKSAGWTRSRPPPDNKVSFVFDDEDPRTAANALSIYLEHKRSIILKDALDAGALAFASSADVQPLQAADLFAFCINRDRTNLLLQKNENFPVVKPFRRLLDGIRKDAKVQNINTLRKGLRLVRQNESLNS